jgi:hypothetical protein
MLDFDEFQVKLKINMSIIRFACQKFQLKITIFDCHFDSITLIIFQNTIVK